jgi:hypothetical protein
MSLLHPVPERFVAVVSLERLSTKAASCIGMHLRRGFLNAIVCQTLRRQHYRLPIGDRLCAVQRRVKPRYLFQSISQYLLSLFHCLGCCSCVRLLNFLIFWRGSVGGRNTGGGVLLHRSILGGVACHTQGDGTLDTRSDSFRVVCEGQNGKTRSFEQPRPPETSMCDMPPALRASCCDGSRAAQGK